MNNYDFIILGAGISGITFARLLQMNNITRNFLVIEKEEEPGGLCRTKNIDGHILDIGGGHFLCSKYKEVYDFIFKHISKDNFNYIERVSKIKLGNNLIDYPIEYNLWQLPEEIQLDYLLSIVERTKNKNSSSYCEWILNNLGKKIANDYMIPYNKKIWGLSPNEMDVNWIYKIPDFNLRDILKSIIFKYSDKNKMPSHSYFYYPKHGGFQSLFSSIYNPVKDNVILSEEIASCDFSNGEWVINGTYRTKKIINTIPWPELYGKIFNSHILKDQFRSLRYSSLEVNLALIDYKNDIHWIYIPDSYVNHHREFYISNFAQDSRPGSIYTETNIVNRSNRDIYDYIYKYTNKYAYPIPVKNYKKNIGDILEYYESMGFYGLGRWGQWEYFNADICIKENFKLINNI